MRDVPHFLLIITTGCYQKACYSQGNLQESRAVCEGISQSGRFRLLFPNQSKSTAPVISLHHPHSPHSPLIINNRNSIPSDSAVQPSPKTVFSLSQRPSSSLSSVSVVSMMSPQRPRRSCSSFVSVASTAESSSRSTRPP